MSLASRKALVDQLTRAAALSAEQQALHYRAIRRWKQQKVATPGTLALAFAAGSFWAAGRRRKRRGVRRGVAQNLIGAANTGLLAWRLLGASKDDKP